jgi:hypothetical protein
MKLHSSQSLAKAHLLVSPPTGLGQPEENGVAELMPCLLVIRRFSRHTDTVFPFRQRDADGRPRRRHGVAGTAGRESSVLATAVLLTHELQRLVVAKAVYPIC